METRLTFYVQESPKLKTNPWSFLFWYDQSGPLAIFYSLLTKPMNYQMWKALNKIQIYTQCCLYLIAKQLDGKIFPCHVLFICVIITRLDGNNYPYRVLFFVAVVWYRLHSAQFQKKRKKFLPVHEMWLSVTKEVLRNVVMKCLFCGGVTVSISKEVKKL